MEIKVNTILKTKDGRIIGNGIVTSVKKINGVTMIGLVTDYGNTLEVTQSWVEEKFYIHGVAFNTHKNFNYEKEKK